MNYELHYQTLISRAKSRINNPTEYYESHHILPKCMGGNDSDANLVDLTPEEHYTAHLLLVKLYPNNPKLIIAASMMTVNRNTNKRYGWLRRKHAEAMSVVQSGTKNSQYGTVWMHCLEKQVSIKVPKDQIPDKMLEGWKLGRVIDFSFKGSCVVCGKQMREKTKTCSQECLAIHQQTNQKHKSPLFGREQEFLDLYASSKSINKALKIMGFGGNNSHWGKHARKLIAELAQR